MRRELSDLAEARRAERRGRLDEAERLYRPALAVRPDWVLAAVPLARLVAARAEPTAAEAIAEARRILEAPRASQPRHALLAVVEAELLLDEDRADEAKALLVAARGPRVVALALARAENAIGVQLASAGRTDEAAFAFKRACDLDADWAPPRANLGALWQRLGRAQKAREQYERALALDPTHALASFNLGTLLRARGDFEAAHRAFTRAARAPSPHAEARRELARNLAMMYARDGRLIEAAALLREADGNSEPPPASK